jgi:hypothetical protein
MLKGYNKEWGDERYSKVKEFVDKYFKLRMEHILPRIEKSGMFSKEFIEKVRNNEKYATYKVLRELDAAAGDAKIERIVKSGGAPTGAHKAIGTVKGIGNTFLATLENDFAMMSYISRNDLTKKAVEFLAKHRDNKMGFNAVPITPSRRGMAGMNRFDVSDTGPQDIGGKPYEAVFYRKNGTVIGYMLPKEIAKSVKDSPHDADAILNMTRGQADFFRNILTQKNPFFWIWNVQKDFKGTHFNIAEGNIVKKGFKWFEALPEVFSHVTTGKLSDDFKEALMTHAMLSHSAYDGAPAWTKFDKSLDETFKGPSNNAQIRWSQNMLNKIGGFLNKANELFEHTSKLAGYKLLKEKRPDLDAHQIAQMTRTRVGTPDILAGGSWTPYTNTWFLFSNMQVQGLRENWNSMREHKARSAFLFALYAGVPMAITALADNELLEPLLDEIGLGELGKWWQDRVRAIP